MIAATLAATVVAFTGPVFELDLFINDPAKGYQPTGFPDYLQHSAKNYTNVAGVSFVQPADLMNDAYDLPAEVAAAVKTLRAQGVAVQLLVGGEISQGWPDLQANPAKAANNAIRLMKAHDVGLEVDNEAGGNADGVIQFLKLCAAGKPADVHLSMDINGTPGADQVAVAKGAADVLEWINLMVSNPAYDQTNSVNFAIKDGIPAEKLTVAYYAGTWVNNCNDMGSASSPGDLAAGVALVKKMGLKGASVWAVGGASYGNCKTDSAPGFAQTMKALGL